MNEADTPLNVQALRELIREARGGFAPDYVGERLLHRYPSISEPDAGEVARLLQGLVDSARTRLFDAGIEPVANETEKKPRLIKREREYVANIAALTAHVCNALMLVGKLEEARSAGEESVAWCRMIGDHHQASIAWRTVTYIYSGLQLLDEQEQGAREALAEARLSGDVTEIIASIDFLCSFLIVRYRLDEAEALNEEGLALAKEHEETKRFYPGLLLDKARIKVHQTSNLESIRICREALRWCGEEDYPMDRASILSFLGTTYLRLGQFRQCIECHHQVIQIAETMGSEFVRGWGYFRLAEAHLAMDEMKRAEEMLDRAHESAMEMVPQLSSAITIKRLQIYAATNRLDEAADLSKRILANLDNDWLTGQIAAHRTLAEIEERREHYEEAEQHRRRVIQITSLQGQSMMVSAAQLFLAELLHRMGRDAEALLAAIDDPERMSPQEQARLLHLRAAIAERSGDMTKALEYEREAFARERELLERRAEESLRNARMVTEIDLLEREADLERERRKRLEHELADAVVEIRDRQRLVESVEERLRTALKRAGIDQKSATTTVLRETLSELRAQAKPSESPLRYLNGIDEDFYHRLRERWPDLTPKQERLCALLRAGLGSKEISTLLGLEPEGLKAQRKRLRKRLGLGLDERLETVLGEV